MSGPTIDEAEAAIARGERVPVVLGIDTTDAVISAWRVMHEQTGGSPHVPTMNRAIRTAAEDVEVHWDHRRHMAAEKKRTRAERQRKQEEEREAAAVAEARRKRLDAAELARLRKEGFPRPPGTMTRTKNYYLPVVQALQMLPEPVPFELDSLFIRALEHYAAERKAADLGWDSATMSGPLKDSIGRLLWAAIKAATVEVRRLTPEAER